MRICFELHGGPLDGLEIMEDDLRGGESLPGTEILDKPTGALYRYHHPSSEAHPVYTHRPAESAGSGAWGGAA